MEEESRRRNDGVVGREVGGKGNEGVAGYVKQIAGSIGYVEYAYVLQNKLAYTLMQNTAGKYVPPNAEASRRPRRPPIGRRQGLQPGHDQYAGANAWPITATTFVVMYKRPKNAAASASAKKFFSWAMTKGQKQAAASTMCRFRRRW